MNLRNSIAGLGLVAGGLFPAEAGANEVPGQHPQKEHSHYNHLAFGAEMDAHRILWQILYTRELLDHVSVGAAVGFGEYKGGAAGSVEAVGSFHTGIYGPAFFVGEVGVGAEVVSRHAVPMAKLTALFGVRPKDFMGLSVGPSVTVTPHGATPAAAAFLAVGF